MGQEVWGSSRAAQGVGRGGAVCSFNQLGEGQGSADSFCFWIF